MKILISVDDKDYGHALANFVVSHQWPENSQFKIINVVERITAGSFGGIPGDVINNIIEERQRRGRSLVLDVGSQIRKAFPLASIEEQAVEGRPKEKILDIASEWEADLLAMGSHGRQGLERLFLGSVSLAVLSHAPCSVMIVRLPKEENSQPQSQAVSGENNKVTATKS